jgi:sulfide:quinone oxidoreductase
MSDSRRAKVLIVGGGSAALEAAFHLQRLAEDRVETTILAPDEHFATQALAVLAPFGAGHVPREPLAALAADAGARLRRGRMVSVDAAGHHILTADVETLPYDALLIAVGAVQQRPWPHTLTFGTPGAGERMHGLVQDLEAGYVRRVAFLVPAGASWPVPLYELALMAAERAYEQCQHCELVVATAEDAPLGLFGAEPSRGLAGRLAKAGVTLVTGVHVDVPAARRVELHPGGRRLTVDRVVTLPVLEGPAVEGLPRDARGFLPVDRNGRVTGVDDVYAAGDATCFPIKQGGLACQQADAAAEAIAASAGADITPRPYAPILRGILLTEHAATFMLRDAGGAAGDDGRASERPLWWPPTKIAGHELGLHLDAIARYAERAPAGIAARLPVTAA